MPMDFVETVFLRGGVPQYRAMYMPIALNLAGTTAVRLFKIMEDIR
jgi:hypothetical protein